LPPEDLAIIFQGEFDSNAKARPPEGLNGQRGKEEGRLLVVVILRKWQLRRHLCLLYIASKALESLKYIGFDISSMVGG
jgi:hypothetical protein